MCGFVGSFSLNSTNSNRTNIAAAMNALEHRGPDAEGFISERFGIGHMLLGFRRLAILDISTQSNQPQSSRDGRFEIVFNGEIYNYIELRDELSKLGFKFDTNGDTEVLLSAWEAWGEASLNKVIGMFAFVIIDRLKAEVVCVRDPFGIKPFFYSDANLDFTFASEVQAIRIATAQKFSMNSKIAERYLLTGNYDQGDETFFEGIYSLKPGHLIKFHFDLSKPRFEQLKWWTSPTQDFSELSFRDSVELLREEFLNSVNFHLRSDVKIATALSGGLDSSAIVAAIRHLYPKVEIDTFSFVANSPRIDESYWIDRVNRALRAKEHLVQIDKADFYQDMDDLIFSQGEPFGSTGIYAQYRVFKEAKENDVTVMLDGQGSDELFAGYFGYPENRLRSLVERREIAGAITFASNWSKYPDRSLGQLLRSYTKDSEIPGISNLIRKFRMNSAVPDFYLGDYKFAFHTLELDKRGSGRGDRLTQRLLTEQSVGILPRLLRHADRNAMRWSIESRVPFLTPGLSSLGLSVPEDFLVSQEGVTKHLLREALRGIVPDEVIDRKDKIGFETPQKEWLEGLVELKSEIFSGIDEIEFLHPQKTRDFLRQFDPNNVYQSSLLWRTYNLIRWHQLFF
jgi:asparagine synthase (glutamine-hydrolysing)